MRQDTIYAAKIYLYEPYDGSDCTQCITAKQALDDIQKYAEKTGSSERDIKSITKRTIGMHSAFKGKGGKALQYNGMRIYPLRLKDVRKNEYRNVETETTQETL